MNITRASALLGGLSPAQFMKRHWQKKPLLVRQAVPGVAPPMGRAALFELAGQGGVESRLVERDAEGWRLRSGPFARRSLPPLARPGWTLLVQGVDLHLDAAHELLQRFRFIPDARLDDLMISYATDGGGVGPHFDSYDVFLLQVQGRRRWRIGRQRDLTLQAGAPLKLLARFTPEQTFDLDPGDMLYLPPRWAHDGVALGACMTCSIGFRAPAAHELARELMHRIADAHGDAVGAAARPSLYRDSDQPAAASPGRIPSALQAFAQRALHAAQRDPLALSRALGEVLCEPKATVWFERRPTPRRLQHLVLDRRTRMLFDEHHVFINGESHRARGQGAALLRRLADRRMLGPSDLRDAGPALRALLSSWCEAGWLHPSDPAADDAA
ncbi:MAG: hypothetical protein OJF60_001420 [Burkholderiaceae bacterium]|jgi:50S ribosomal protein L16 3-hydroxylase|nr:MAG: hypothetical protein OJF60_001420 [Burkholderiaceae bacterium]